METDNKRTGVKAFVVSDQFSPGGEQPGACRYWKEAERLMFACPGCGLWGSVRIGNPKPTEKPSWDIVAGTTDDLTTLTLQPSIHCVGCCGWHGHLVKGVFVSV